MKLSDLPFFLKLLVSVLAIGVGILFNIFFFIQYAPDANTATYNTTITTKASFMNIKKERRRYSFQIRNRDKKNTAQKYTIFFFHNLPGSRFFYHVNESEILERQGIQFVRFDRPSFGYSHPVKNQNRFERIIKDVEHFIKVLKLDSEENYGFIGFGFGAPYALEMSRLTKRPVALISPIGKFNKEEVLEESIEFLRKFKNKIQKYPQITRFLFKLYAQLGYICNPNLIFKNIRKFELLNEEDIDLFKDIEWNEILNNTFIEMFRQGVTGFVEELDFIFSDKWNGLKVHNKNNRKIKIFHGSNDILCKERMFKNLVKDIGDCEVEVDNYSHFTSFEKFFEEAIEFVLN